jgi:hypothetical protein
MRTKITMIISAKSVAHLDKPPLRCKEGLHGRVVSATATAAPVVPHGERRHPTGKRLDERVQSARQDSHLARKCHKRQSLR